MIYQFRKGTRVSGVKAQDVGEALERIRKSADGILETERVVSEAQKKRSPIHGAFEWNDKKAGHEFRLIQARQLIRAIVILVEDDEEPAYVHVQIDKQNYYQSTGVAAKNVDEWDLVRGQALRQLESASGTLDRLDRVASRVNAKSSGVVRSVKKQIDKASQAIGALR